MTKNNNKIDIKKWEKLYQLAIEFEKLAPWDWMVDTDLFAIMDQKTKKVAYCSVMGNNGEFYGLGIYPGAEGFIYFDLVARGEIVNTDEMMHVQKCLMMSYDKRDSISKEEMKTIKKVGVRFDNRNFWPQFRDYSPGYYPWSIAPDDMDFLIDTIEQVLVAVLDFKEREEEFLAYLPEKIFVRKMKKIRGKMLWAYEYLSPEKNIKKDEIPTLNEMDEVLCYELRKNIEIISDLKWELDYFYAAEVVRGKEESDRPYYPYILLTVDNTSGRVESAGLLHSSSQREAMFRKLFLEAIQKSGTMPEVLLIRNPRLAEVIQVVADILQIEIKLSDDLPMLEIAKDSFL